MIFPLSLWIVGFFMSVLVNFVSYFAIREIIWSIIWCDKKGKYSALKHVKKKLSFFQRITMRNLKQYTSIHEKNFLFWLKIKLFFTITEIILLLFYCICMVFHHHFLCQQVMIFIIIQSYVLFFILRCQFGFQRRTKYDRSNK